MKLDTEFYKLPLRFNVERLLQEISQFNEKDWIPHPTGFSGNTSLILVSVDGTVNHEFSISGSMKSTPFLERCPYIKQVMKALDVPISRTRLMRIAAQGEVPPHSDNYYHWYRRIRIHVPIMTNPSVEFFCNGKVVHMAAGEAWTFNNYEVHRVVNGMQQSRIHLVIDTKGSPVLWKMLEQSEQPYASVHTSSKEQIYYVPYSPESSGEFELEPYDFEVFTSEEICNLTDDILLDIKHSQMSPNDSQKLVENIEEFRNKWKQVFADFGHNQDGELDYQNLILYMKEEIVSKIKTAIPSEGKAERAIRNIATMLLKSNDSYNWRQELLD
ncbi:hypothetical protein BV378_05465 [Nostoc sp. RF31YmG]|nr:hypothetical protein BV378_05465 [Nostoc sp. RF31YmG]